MLVLSWSVMAFLDSMLSYCIIIATLQIMQLSGRFVIAKQSGKESINIDWGLAISSVFLAPLKEEFIFRYLLKKVLGDLPYANFINSLLFGAAHLINLYTCQNMTTTAVTVQSLMAVYAGMVYIQRPFWKGLMFHFLHNLFVVGTNYLLYVLV